MIRAFQFGRQTYDAEQPASYFKYYIIKCTMQHIKYNKMTGYLISAATVEDLGLCCISPTRRAGTPATTAQAGTSRVTTDPAPTMAPSPIVIPDTIVAFDPIEAPRHTRVSSTIQSDATFSSPLAEVALGS